MAKTKSFIEINGRRYDALTGVLLAAGGNPREILHIPAIRSVEASPKPSAPKTKRHRPVHPVAAHAPTPARTLMRRAVTRPGPGTKRRLKAIAWINASEPQPVFDLAVKFSALRLDDKRLRHAQLISQSRSISRFSQAQAFAVPVRVVPAATTPQPQPVIRHSTAPKPKRPKTTADILELAMQHATSHLQPPVEPVHHRRLWHRKAAGAH